MTDLRPALSARSDAMALTITDAPDRRRFEIAVDGVVVGFAQYRRRPGIISFIHTEIDTSFEGEGLGTLLVKAALDIARAEGLAVLPYCPFVKDFIDRHREYLDLVPVERRAKFALKDAVPPHTGDGRHRALLRIPQQSGRVVVDIGG
jgi:predicted GNAT family acetyltransferase